MHEYAAKLVRVVDGDTVDLEVDLGFSVRIVERFRLAGVDAPELRGPRAEEARMAKGFVEEWFAGAGGLATIRTTKDRREKFGRYLVDAVRPGEAGPTLVAKLLELGLAKPYDGGKR